MTVQFLLPRPGSPALPEAEPEDADVVEEYRACADCGQSKPGSEFVAGSERCQACYDQIQAEVRGRFGD